MRVAFCFLPGLICLACGHPEHKPSRTLPRPTPVAPPVALGTPRADTEPFLNAIVGLGEAPRSAVAVVATATGAIQCTGAAVNPSGVVVTHSCGDVGPGQAIAVYESPTHVVFRRVSSVLRAPYAARSNPLLFEGLDALYLQLDADTAVTDTTAALAQKAPALQAARRTFDAIGLFQSPEGMPRWRSEPARGIGMQGIPFSFAGSLLDPLMHTLGSTPCADVPGEILFPAEPSNAPPVGVSQGAWSYWLDDCRNSTGTVFSSLPAALFWLKNSGGLSR